jgi:hypothetical protein
MQVAFQISTPYISLSPKYSLRKQSLTVAIGLQTNEESPIARSNPPVDKLTASGVVLRSLAISCATLSNDVEENVEPRVAQLRTKTIKHLRQKGILLSNPDLAVWLFSNGLELEFVLGSALLLGFDGEADEGDLFSSILGYLDDESSSMIQVR